MSNAMSSKWSVVGIAVVVLAALSIPLRAQDAANAPQGSYVDDWSHHHLVFSNPGTREDAIKNGKLAEWKAITSSPHYQMQQARRGTGTPAAATAPVLSTGEFLGGPRGSGFRGIGPLHSGRPLVRNPIVKDWTQPLGGVATALASAIPATLSSSLVSSSSTITVDGQTFTASPPTQGTQTGTFTGAATSGDTVTIANTVPANTLVLYAIPGAGEGTVTFTGDPTAGNPIQIGTVTYQWHSTPCTVALEPCVVRNSATVADNATNLEEAINNTCGSTANCVVASANPDATATASGAVVTITNTTSGSITFTDGGANTTQDPASGVGIPPASASNGCSSSTGGYFEVGTSSTTAASFLATALTACNTTYPAAGVTATSGGTATVTLTADTPGSAPGVTLSDTSSGGTFSWSGGEGTTFTNGTNGTDSSTTFAYWSGSTYDTGTQLATDLHTALGDNGTVSGVMTTTAGTNKITFTATGAGPYEISTLQFKALSPLGTIGTSTVVATVQPNAYPAEYGTSPTSASCTDWVAYPTGQKGSGVAATIIAYTNLYTSCPGTVPTVMWALNTGSTYAVTTSPIISANGTDLIFVQSTGSAAELVVLQPGTGGGTLTAPSTPTAATGGNIATGCGTGPCEATVALGADDTYSSPFYTYNGVASYGADVAFVGTNNGTLLQITPVLNAAVGTPASVNLPGAGDVSSPVFDPASGCVFAGDVNGILYSVDAGFSTTFTTCNSGSYQLQGYSANMGNAAGDGMYDGPIVDSSADAVYAFITDSGAVSGKTRGSCVIGNNCVVEFNDRTLTPTNEGTAAPVVAEPLGTGALGHPIYAGAFDNVYFVSTSGTGNLYAIGNAALSPGGTLYQLPISNGTISGAPNTAVSGLSSAGFPWPSPVTEFCSGACSVSGGVTTGTDYMFFSVNASGKTGCMGSATNGCILAYNADHPASLPIPEVGSGLNVVTPGTNGCWATGGLVIDNNDTVTGGASQIYFTNYNGTDAGAAGGSPLTSSSCSAGSTVTLQGVQAQQSNP